MRTVTYNQIKSEYRRACEKPTRYKFSIPVENVEKYVSNPGELQDIIVQSIHRNEYDMMKMMLNSLFGKQPLQHVTVRMLQLLHANNDCVLVIEIRKDTLNFSFIEQQAESVFCYGFRTAVPHFLVVRYAYFTVIHVG